LEHYLPTHASVIRKIDVNLDIVRTPQALIFWHCCLFLIALSCCLLYLPLVNQAPIWVLVGESQTAAIAARLGRGEWKGA
jgi:hypothetical protein